MSNIAIIPPLGIEVNLSELTDKQKEGLSGIVGMVDDTKKILVVGGGSGIGKSETIIRQLIDSGIPISYYSDVEEQHTIAKFQEMLEESAPKELPLFNPIASEELMGGMKGKKFKSPFKEYFKDLERKHHTDNKRQKRKTAKQSRKRNRQS